MIESIAQIKKGKSADHDKITPEMLKNLDPRGLLKLHMNEKLITIVENTLAESQSVFRKGRSIQDHVFTIKQVVEKNRIKNQELYKAFLDLEKAFDRVSQKEIWRSIEQFWGRIVGDLNMLGLSKWTGATGFVEGLHWERNGMD
ncbi:uncharacterized protein LOC135125712 [Zophobas morio]|uniref:uncharacterized protein LOC135125712 n=1 Tax=Zophobas morio TaxID=2755281 RepID=UPI00308310A7